MMRARGRDREDNEKRAIFERERLLNLIDSRIRIRDIETAGEFAEELLRAEIKFAVFLKMRELRRFNAALMKIILVMTAVLFAAVIFMVLNINPSFNLAVQASAVTSIVGLVILDTIIVKRFENAVAGLMDCYETRRQYFVSFVLDNVEHKKAFDIAAAVACLTAAKQGM